MVRTAAMARLGALAATLALIGLFGVGPALGDPGSGARAAGPLPACRYDDILTSPRGYGDWPVTLVDTILRLTKSYAPPDLVRVADLGVPGRGRVRAVMAEDLKAMSDAAAAAGSAIGVHSPYRSYAEQQGVFAHWVDVHGYNGALKLSARPGHSEHQLGLAVDFRSDPPVSTLLGSWGATPAGKWMRNHAWEYGFVMSYPKGQFSTVCYAYEPWHFRYVGREIAAQVRASGLTLREYLWANFTTTVVPPAPKPTTRPKPTAKPTPAATAEPGPTTAPTASLLPASTPAASAPGSTQLPSTAPTDAAATPQATASPAAPATPPLQGSGGLDASTVASVALAGAGLALGTIVLGGVLLVRRKGRSRVGL